MRTIRRAINKTALALGLICLPLGLLSGCGKGFDDGEDSSPSNQSGPGASNELTSSQDALRILIGSSGEAETSAMKEAVTQWSKISGIEASVQVASDLNQELSQGFAAGSPADLFYLAPEQLAGYAKNGSLKAYGEHLSNKEDFYPSLVENFTYDDQFYCAPKDFSTLALVINKDLWNAAGLTEADYPTTWEELTQVSQALAKDGVAGLAFGAEYQRLGAFMAASGGGLMHDQTPIANSEENIFALEHVKNQLDAGNFAFAADLGAGWGGEALGKGLAAMVVEGNWITGAMQADFPEVDYAVVELPAGPGGKGTLQFTNCWGMASDSPNQKAALELVEHLTSADQQLTFSQAFGPMPSVQSAASQWEEENPELKAFLSGARYAQFVPNIAGIVDIITDFNAQLEGLKTSNVQTLLSSVQANLEALSK